MVTKGENKEITQYLHTIIFVQNTTFELPIYAWVAEEARLETMNTSLTFR